MYNERQSRKVIFTYANRNVRINCQSNFAEREEDFVNCKKMGATYARVKKFCWEIVNIIVQKEKSLYVKRDDENNSKKLFACLTKKSIGI